jgi:hypothetical protein
LLPPGVSWYHNQNLKEKLSVFIIKGNTVVQASLVASVAALGDIVIQKAGTGPIVFTIISEAGTMGAFINAITAFLLFIKDRLPVRDDDPITGKMV